jgi:hypothetical protein
MNPIRDRSPVPCLEGQRAYPPEAVGGVWGYVEFLKAIGNPKHQQHEKMMEWVGGEFDPQAFDPAAATEACQIGRRCYRSGWAPALFVSCWIGKPSGGQSCGSDTGTRLMFAGQNSCQHSRIDIATGDHAHDFAAASLAR